jgi:hypothetical protein
MTNSLMELVTDLITKLDEGTLSAGFSEPLERGSAKGEVSVIRDAQDPQTLIVVVRLDIMTVPATDGARFFQALLTLNHRFHGRASFCIGEQRMVYLMAGRPVDDLDPGELVDLILWTSQQADHYDDLLKNEFTD